MPAAADAARAEVRVWASLQPGHIGLCTNAIFSHNLLTQKRLIYQQFLHTLYCFYNQEKCRIIFPFSLSSWFVLFFCLSSFILLLPMLLSLCISVVRLYIYTYILFCFGVDGASSANLPGRRPPSQTGNQTGTRTAVRQTARQMGRQLAKSKWILQIC